MEKQCITVENEDTEINVLNTHLLVILSGCQDGPSFLDYL